MNLGRLCQIVSKSKKEISGYYGGPQLSQQQQITHSNNKLIATIRKNSHQNQIAHSTNKILTAQTKMLTAPPTKSRRFIVPLSRFEERGNHLAVAGEDLCQSS